MKIETKPIQIKALTPTIENKQKLWNAKTLHEVFNLITEPVQKVKVSNNDFILEFKNRTSIAGQFI